MAEQENRNIGALWTKTSKAGNKFLAGNLEINGEKIEVVVFKNVDKKNEKGPDFSILLSTPYEGGGKTNTSSQPKKAPQKPAPKDDDIDF
jgi:uncharacterized protein (DUF736 family)